MTKEPYLDDYSAALGRVFGNLSTLELLLRVTLETATSPGGSGGWLAGRLITTLTVGELVPVNHFTGWNSLTDLIDEYNASEVARGPAPSIDTGIATMRNALAHGRILSDNAGGPWMLLRFKRPDTKSTTVTVEYVQELTIQWLTEQNRRVRTAIERVVERLSGL